MSTAHYITEEGLQRLRAELAQLKNVERPATSRLIADARDKGDLSENAEYDAAKEAQGLLEMKIAALEEKVANARVIDEGRIDLSQVQVLTKVKIKNVATKAVMEYTLVTETEANIKEGRLAVGTPIAQALLGRKKGDVVDVKVPSGHIKLEILAISKG
jgi:transcription elongation factor GreA